MFSNKYVNEYQYTKIFYHWLSIRLKLLHILFFSSEFRMMVKSWFRFSLGSSSKWRFLIAFKTSSLNWDNALLTSWISFIISIYFPDLKCIINLALKEDHPIRNSASYLILISDALLVPELQLGDRTWQQIELDKATRRRDEMEIFEGKTRQKLAVLQFMKQIEEPLFNSGLLQANEDKPT